MKPVKQKKTKRAGQLKPFKRGRRRRRAGGGIPTRLADVFKLGQVKEIRFRSERDGQLYVHVFKHPPAMLASPNARGAIILKGLISVERSTLEIRG